jgi:hypothetical protein
MFIGSLPSNRFRSTVESVTPEMCLPSPCLAMVICVTVLLWERNLSWTRRTMLISSGLSRRIEVNDVSEDLTASFFRVSKSKPCSHIRKATQCCSICSISWLLGFNFYPDNGGCTFLCIVGKRATDFIVPRYRRSSQPCETEISQAVNTICPPHEAGTR